jgi:hypothetical protein
MAPQHGTRDDGSPPGGFGSFVSALTQFVTFCLLAGTALAVFAAVLLLPDYARLQQAKYQLARQQATMAKLRSLIEGNERYIAELPHDAVLTKRLAMNELGYWPQDEVVVLTDGGPRQPSPGMVVAPAAPQPQPPAGFLMDAARRVADPPARRGLLLLAAIGLAAALLLFPGGKARKRKPAAV